jgi:hypothetical protein
MNDNNIMSCIEYAKQSSLASAEDALSDIVTISRVLALIDTYLANQSQHDLWGADGGMMTVEELREHIKGAIVLATPAPAARSGGE